ncbi:winged helix-turn-helix transcriptional regulator [Haloarcula marismortui ATCC 33800]|nr:winged helix-turn-helix transcriptional regulator [Haloarcula sinaiiensis ATCC 33800]
MAESRDENPSGWLYLTGNESTQRIIDALLDAGTREFNKSELGDYAGMTRQTVGNHIDRLVELNVVEKIERRKSDRYRFNPESQVSQKIIETNGAVIAKRLSEEED